MILSTVIWEEAAGDCSCEVINNTNSLIPSSYIVFSTFDLNSTEYGSLLKGGYVIMAPSYSAWSFFCIQRSMHFVSDKNTMFPAFHFD